MIPHNPWVMQTTDKEVKNHNHWERQVSIKDNNDSSQSLSDADDR